MKLPNLPFLNKKPQEEYFISLILNPKNTVAVLLSNKESKLTIISTKSVSLDLDSASIEEIIAAADEAISSIELSLDEGYSLEKTIFSVPYFWSEDDGSIKKEKLLQLKKLSVELALKPMGFILTVEALIKYFQDKEGVPLSAIFVQEAKNKVFLYLVKGGNIVEVQSGDIDEEVEKAVEHTLKKVEQFDKLPSKMILLYHDDIESRQQNFLNFPWTKDLPFLHLPQISLMEKGFENEAVVDAIASQLNAEVSDRAEISGAEIIESDASNMTDGKDFGFVKEKDVAFSEESEQDTAPDEPVVSVMGKSAQDKDFDNEDKMERIEKSSGGVSAILGLAIAFLSKAPQSITKVFATGSGIKKFFIPIAAAVIFIALMFVYFLLFLRAEVVVFLKGETVKDEVIVSLSEEDETSFSDEILRIDTIEQEVTGNASKASTGVEETGESAKGEITILSSQNQSQKIESGTVLTSSNGLKFTLDDDVNIASSSGVSDIKSAKGKVTAEEIGKEYNLPSGTKFSVTGYDSSSVEAKNDIAFAGGTKEEKKIVAQKDVDSLEAKLLSDLFEDAVNAAKAKVGSDEQIVSVLLDSSISEDNYSASVGDEADSLELDATIIYTLGVYKKEEAKKFIDDARGGDAPEGFVISEDDSDIRLDEIEQDGNRITGRLVYEVLYKPDVDFDNLSEEIKGKSLSSAEELISEKEGVSDVNIVFANKLPLLPSILPMRSDQIDVSIKFEK